jgi:hypothetical protein
MLMRRQFVLTLILMPITFGIWYAAGTLFAAPAVWLCDLFLSNLYPGLVETAGLQGVEMTVRTQFGEIGGQILPAKEAGNQVALQINTRWCLTRLRFMRHYSGAQLQDEHLQILLGLFWLWLHHGVRVWRRLPAKTCCSWWAAPS